MPSDDKPSRGVLSPKVSRRGFLAGSATAGATALTGLALEMREAVAQANAATDADSLVPVRLKVNGTGYDLALDPRTTLLDLLREDLDLTGTKVGCNHGQCGACTVHVNGTRVNSCLSLAVAANGKEITTIEGLATEGEELHPMQTAFITHDGFQCGYCTSGQIMSAIGCVKEGHAGSEADIREYMSGNICRCGAYKGIVEAVVEARDATATAKVGNA